MFLDYFALNHLYFVYYLGQKQYCLTELLYNINCYKAKYKTAKITKLQGQRIINSLIKGGFIYINPQPKKKETYKLTEIGELVYKLILYHDIYVYFAHREKNKRNRKIVCNLTAIAIPFLILLTW